MKKTLAEIGAIIGEPVSSEYKDIVIEHLDSLDTADETSLSFAVEPYIEKARSCHAAAVILPREVTDFPLPAIHADNPKAAFAKLLGIFAPKVQIPEGVSPEAHVGQNVTLGQHVRIMPFAMVDDNAVIGDNVTLYPHCYIGQYAEVGEDTVIYSCVTIREYCRVGKRCVIHSSAVIGSDGFGFTTANGVHTKVPQVGNVVIKDDVEIGAHAGIDRAAMGSTVIGKGTKIDNLVHVGHNCNIGENCLIVAQTGISGSTTVGHNVTFGGQVGTVGHINIGANSVYAARSGIVNNMPEGTFGAGFPVQGHQEWLRQQVVLKHLPEMQKKLRQLEKELAKLKK